MFDQMVRDVVFYCWLVMIKLFITVVLFYFLILDTERREALFVFGWWNKSLSEYDDNW